MKITTTNYHIDILKGITNQRGYFEHVLYGDERAGELIFVDKVLEDYDGVFDLPEEILDALEEEGFNVNYARV